MTNKQTNGKTEQENTIARLQGELAKLQAELEFESKKVKPVKTIIIDCKVANFTILDEKSKGGHNQVKFTISINGKVYFVPKGYEVDNSFKGAADYIKAFK